MKTKDKKMKAVRSANTDKGQGKEENNMAAETNRLPFSQKSKSKQEETKNNSIFNAKSNPCNGAMSDSSGTELSFTSSTCSGDDSPAFPINKTVDGSTLIEQNKHLSDDQFKLSQMPVKSSDERLSDLLNRTKYNHVQRNGQRIYGGPPPNWQGGYPAKGSEVFVGKVPRNVFEDEIVPIFETVGKIYELRLMMDFSGCNRGFFFVCYASPDEAKRAVKELNTYEIRPGKKLGVIASVDNRKLWISGIPKNLTSAEIKADMEKLTDGVRNIILYPSQTDKSKTRGYAFIEYESHRAAALARRKLVPGKIFVCGQEVEKIDWAEPENEVDDETMSKVKILFLRNLMGTTSEEEIRNVFDQLATGQVERVKKAKDYAFVHFNSREAAEKALAGIEVKYGKHLPLGGAKVEITWSKPVDKHIYNQRKQLTKALTTQHFQSGSYIGTVGASGDPFYFGAMDPALVTQAIQHQNDYLKYGGIRKRGAAGVKGLGAPGTVPPRGLVRKLVNDRNGFSDQPLTGSMYPQLAKDQFSNGSEEQLIHTLQDLKMNGGIGAYHLYNNPSNGAVAQPTQPQISNSNPASNAQLGTSSVTLDGAKFMENNQNMVDANSLYFSGGLIMPYPSLPAGYVWPNLYHLNPMAVAAAQACVASAYGAQFMPAGYNRNSSATGTSPNDVTAATQQATQTKSSIVNHRHSSKTQTHTPYAK